MQVEVKYNTTELGGQFHRGSALLAFAGDAAPRGRRSGHRLRRWRGDGRQIWMSDPPSWPQGSPSRGFPCGCEQDVRHEQAQCVGTELGVQSSFRSAGALPVEGGRDLVEDEDAGVLEERPRESHALLFAAAELQPALPDQRAIAFGQAHYRVVNCCGPRRLVNLCGSNMAGIGDARRIRSDYSPDAISGCDAPMTHLLVRGVHSPILDIVENGVVK